MLLQFRYNDNDDDDDEDDDDNNNNDNNNNDNNNWVLQKLFECLIFNVYIYILFLAVYINLAPFSIFTYLISIDC